MSKVYSLIRRSDFTDLYKYGQFTLNPLNTVEFEGDIEQEEARNALIRNLFEHSNSFDSSFAYLIIQYSPNNYIKEHPIVNIEEVEHVYPLNAEAKREFEASFDEHIRLETPVFANAFEEIQKLKTIRGCEKGALNIAQLYGFADSIEKCKSIISTDILREVVDEVYANRRPNGNLPIWVYLLRYERHAFYPPTMVGFFMDIVNVICNFLSKGEVDDRTVECTDVYRVLSPMNGNLSFKDIFSNLDHDKQSQAFLKTVKEIDPNVDFMKVAVMFLFLKDRYSAGLQKEDSIIKKVIGNDDYILSAYMLGLVYGHEKTYACLYESLPLQIYKSKEEMDIIRKEHENERCRAAEEMRHMEDERKKEESVHKQHPLNRYGKNHDRHEYEDCPAKVKDNAKTEGQQLEFGFPKEENVVPSLPCKMAKLKKGTIQEFCLKPKPKMVKTGQEYLECYDEGWRRIDN